MENIRLFLIVTLSFLGLMLWQAWEEDYATPPAPAVTNDTPAAPADAPQIPPPTTAPADDAAPPIASAAPVTDPAVPTATVTPAGESLPIDIRTDLFAITIDTRGGTIVQSALLEYPIDPKLPEVPVQLFVDQPPKIYVYQGGLAGDTDLPTHHADYTATSDAYVMADGAEELVVPLSWRSEDGTVVEKRFRFKRDSYQVSVEYNITNGTQAPIRVHQYEQLKRNEESSRQGLVYTFTGAALSTPEKRFEKFDLGDLDDQPLDVTVADGWVGIIQHYFVSALVPPAGQEFQFYSKVLTNNVYLVGFLSTANEIAPGAQQQLASRIYIGPKRHDRLGNVAPGLELSVDYGVLWFIAKPLFSVLAFIHDLTGNWGWAIILLTILLKLLFFPLSAAGYRSMANMRKVQPRMLALRDRYADDRAQLNQAMMTLYKEEKINPLGGCLPILIQIPVFIALYWVLLESVEMRQAPFVLWLDDLSTRDPYFVLPLLMGISMWAQQKLNPAPLDPMQAKVMQILPFVFTVFFAFFPSGLVLYWLVNNILSIAQQWQITRSIEAGES